MKKYNLIPLSLYQSLRMINLLYNKFKSIRDFFLMSKVSTMEYVPIQSVLQTVKAMMAYTLYLQAKSLNFTQFNRRWQQFIICTLTTPHA